MGKFVVLGAGTFGRRAAQVFLGRDYTREKNYSEQTAVVIDKEVREILSASYVRATKLLKRNREKLVRLAESVLKKEVLEAAEIDVIVNGKKGAEAKGKGKKAPARRRGKKKRAARQRA